MITIILIKRGERYSPIRDLASRATEWTRWARDHGFGIEMARVS